MIKALSCLLFLVFLAGCSSVSSFKADPINVAHSPAVFLRIKNDPAKFSSEVNRRLAGLGFKVVEDAGKADYYAEVEYSTYFDVVQQTFNYFDISLVEAGRGQTKVRSRYVGRFGFNNCTTALNLVFGDLSAKLKR